MLDGYFSYKPAYNPYFTPVVGPYQVTRHGSPQATEPSISPRAAISDSQTAAEQAQLRPPSVGSWTERTPASVTVGGLIDVYDTDQ